MDKPKFRGESGRRSTPDDAIYQIPIIHDCVEVGHARLTPDGRLTVAMHGVESAAGQEMYKALRSGKATAIDISLR